MKYLKAQKKFLKNKIKKIFFNEKELSNISKQKTFANTKYSEVQRVDAEQYQDYVNCYYSATRWK